MTRGALALSLAGVVVVASGGPAGAVSHAEVGDAGDLLANAQVPSGSGALTQITGTVSAREDVDLYKICVDSNAAFSATTSGTAGTLGDTQLFLFNATGQGVEMNDQDTPAGPGPTSNRSTLPLAHNPGPTSGTYYLAISAYDTDALTAPSPGGFLIFPEPSGTEVVGSISSDRTLGGWNDNLDNPLSPSTYTIALTGAQPWANPCPPPPTTTPGGPGTVCAGTLPTPTIVGTSGPDNLAGTAGPDVIAGLGGDDRIVGLGGDDIILGGAGVDRLVGGDGADLLCGGTEGDYLTGGNDNDRLGGEAGDDQLSGDAGDDSLDGGFGTNLNDGGAGTDTCVNGTSTTCAP
jgi:Ca2+-binding RTX toxin-like protein